MSGGGGWGAKKGLLALDPETTYGTSASDEAALEQFERTLMQKLGGIAQEGIVTPGSHIQFFISPPGSFRSAGSKFAAPHVFGVSHAGESKQDPQLDDGVLVHNGLFGGLSDYGLYIRSQADAGSGKRSITTKLDAPFTFVAG